MAARADILRDQGGLHAGGQRRRAAVRLLLRPRPGEPDHVQRGRRHRPPGLRGRDQQGNQRLLDRPVLPVAEVPGTVYLPRLLPEPPPPDRADARVGPAASAAEPVPPAPDQFIYNSTCPGIEALDGGLLTDALIDGLLGEGRAKNWLSPHKKSMLSGSVRPFRLHRGSVRGESGAGRRRERTRSRSRGSPANATGTGSSSRSRKTRSGKWTSTS